MQSASAITMNHPKLLYDLSDVTLGYGEAVILRAVTLRIEQGDFYAIVGPNGSGKTTLLKCLLGILKPLGGQVARAQPIRIGYVPQRESVDALWPVTVRDVARFGCSASERRTGVADIALEQVGLADKAPALYRDLSGGQKQRALIARALANRPDLLILDEPTNGMDLPSEKAVLDLIQQLHQDRGLTVVVVTHLLNTAAAYARHLAVIEGCSLRSGIVDEMLQESVLSQVYGIEVQVAWVNGRPMVLAKEAHNNVDLD